ncbi:MAG: cysteine--tRNA ligase [Pseudomonadota bacterium]
MLMLHNTLTRQKEVFKPMQAGQVRMYVCGMTVYDLCHLGHARVLVVFDMIYRYLQAIGYEVTYVRNITDIDDKIIRRALENGEPWQALTERYIQAMHADAAALGVLPPSAEPRATDHIPAIIAMTQRLIDKGHAYPVANGDVYYRVHSFADYGRLSGKTIADLQVGARIQPGEQKQDPLDFALWKGAKPEEPAWDSPWGPGRPGWHIECSAMSTQSLGDSFDIHGGGADLAFPHHENEIAQSEAATGHPFVNYWLHNGFVRINDEKMSKSLGNFFTIRDVMQNYTAEEIRYFILASHYRSPLHYAEAQLAQARASLTRLYTALRDLPTVEPTDAEQQATTFHAAMADDFNTPEALAVLFSLARDINRTRQTEPAQAAGLAATLRTLGGILGLLQQAPDDYLRGEAADGLSTARIEQKIAQRASAKAAKDWATADQIRAELTAAGILLEDSQTGTRWRRQSSQAENQKT